MFIACFSRASLNRKLSYQNAEIALAIEQMQLRRPDVPWLVPVRFDDCAIPSLDLGGHRTLGSIQRADLFGNNEDRDGVRLVEAVRRLLGRQPASPERMLARLKAKGRASCLETIYRGLAELGYLPQVPEPRLFGEPPEPYLSWLDPARGDSVIGFDADTLWFRGGEAKYRLADLPGGKIQTEGRYAQVLFAIRDQHVAAILEGARRLKGRTIPACLLRAIGASAATIAMASRPTTPVTTRAGG